MADEQQGRPQESGGSPEPRGFGEHTRGLPGEYAHEQGWGLDEEERKRQAGPPRDTDGGNNYNYSAQDFGDEPVNMAGVGSQEDEEAARRALGIIQQKEKK
ncbi:MAG TPA: hypothetical protein VHU44_00690 [Acidobacteriaceae bacterium]|jgi:hypothetical protein|nr:hypothetical protein [Acidobacteriaceae bacterium]